MTVLVLTAFVSCEAVHSPLSPSHPPLALPLFPFPLPLFPFPPPSPFPLPSMATRSRVRTDHNEDNTSAILQEWCAGVEPLYSNVDFESSAEWLYPDRDPFQWPDERYDHITKLRQQALDAARAGGHNYLFVSCLCAVLLWK